MAEKLDEKARSAFKEGLAHLQRAQQWKEQQDADRRDDALKKARKSLDKVVQRAPYFDEGWVELSHVYEEMRDFNLAKYVLDKALEYTPRSDAAVLAKAEILEKQGMPGKLLKKVFTPIGLPIGAESPEEIALSIVSELVCVRRKGPEQAKTLRAAVGFDL